MVEPSRVYELLERVGAIVRAEERRLAGGFQLHPVHLHALRYLTRCNRYSDNPAAVTEYLGVTKGTASQTLRLLRERLLVESRQDNDDGRKQHLRLTRAGDRIVERCTPLPRFVAALGNVDSDSPSLGPALESFLRTLQRSNSFRPFGVCRSCCHLQHNAGKAKFRCGLTGEALDERATSLICREFEAAVAT